MIIFLEIIEKYLILQCLMSHELPTNQALYLIEGRPIVIVVVNYATLRLFGSNKPRHYLSTIV